MSTLEMIVKAADITVSKKINNVPGEDLEASATGLFLADDSSDPTASTLTAQADLVDGDFQTVTSGTITGSYSIGLDLLTSQTVQKLIIYDVIDGNYSGIDYNGVNDTFVVYESELNDGSADSWVLVETFKPLNRVVYLDTDSNPSPVPSPLPSPLPYSTITNTVYKIELVFGTPPKARYIKVYASRGAVQDAGESVLQISEIQALIQPALALASISKKNILKAKSIVVTEPIAVTGDGSGDAEVPLF